METVAETESDSQCVQLDLGRSGEAERLQKVQGTKGRSVTQWRLVPDRPAS